LFQLNQMNSSATKEDSKKKEILSNIWKEQRLMSANISNLHLRKAKDKEALLNDIVNCMLFIALNTNFSLY
jgi:hypothetical protein